MYEDLPVEDLGRLFTVKDLKSILKARGLKLSGSKKDLVARLAEAASGVASDTQNEVSEEVEVKEDLGALTVTELKARLQDLGLKSSGKKADLVTRLSQATLPDPVDTAGSVVEDSLARQTQMDVQPVTPQQTVQASKPPSTKPVELNIDSKKVTSESGKDKILSQSPPRRSSRKRYTRKGFVDRVFDGPSTHQKRAWQSDATLSQSVQQKRSVEMWPDFRKVSWETEVTAVKEKLFSEVCDHELWTEHEGSLTSWGCDVELWTEIGRKYGTTQTQELARLATEGDAESVVELISMFRRACRMPAAAKAHDKPVHDLKSEGETQAGSFSQTQNFLRRLQAEEEERQSLEKEKEFKQAEEERSAVRIQREQNVENTRLGADSEDGNSALRNWALQTLLRQP